MIIRLCCMMGMATIMNDHEELAESQEFKFYCPVCKNQITADLRESTVEEFQKT